MRITFFNNFHNTKVSVNSNDWTLSSRQVARIRKTLCGIADCMCGGVYGTQRYCLLIETDGSGLVVDDLESLKE